MAKLLSNTEEKYLLTQISRGDRESYKKLFYMFYGDLCRFCIRYVRTEEIAEEIVQDVFIYLWEKRDVVNISISIKSYLYTAVRNKSINYLKLQLPKDQLKDDIDQIDVAVNENAESEITYEELKRKIDEGINLLPLKCQNIFRLSRESGLTYKEIADKEGISVKTVENQMVIALRKLREHLGDVWDRI